MADGKFHGAHMRVHPNLQTYLRQRQARERERRQRDVTMMEVTEAVASELVAAEATTTTNQGEQSQ